jgi:VIT1/CCC1 family predicted Fe2+/Mn2+ transporter
MPPTDSKPQTSAGLNARLNRLRAGVLGANDGIVSVAGIVIGVAGATASQGAIATAGLAGLVAGALSMAVGEYVSVHSQRDTERAVIDEEQQALQTKPEEELDELTQMYRCKGLSDPLARQVAVELTQNNPLEAHLETEFKMDASDLSSPWAAAVSSALSFVVGALLPLLVIVFTPAAIRIPLTFGAVVVALAITGTVSSRLGRAPMLRAILRNVIGGAVAMAITYLIGRLVGML